jgi:hypothetical protein
MVEKKKISNWVFLVVLLGAATFMFVSLFFLLPLES